MEKHCNPPRVAKLMEEEALQGDLDSPFVGRVTLLPVTPWPGSHGHDGCAWTPLRGLSRSCAIFGWRLSLEKSPSCWAKVCSPRSCAPWGRVIQVCFLVLQILDVSPALLPAPPAATTKETWPAFCTTSSEFVPAHKQPRQREVCRPCFPSPRLISAPVPALSDLCAHTARACVRVAFAGLEFPAKGVQVPAVFQPEKGEAGLRSSNFVNVLKHLGTHLTIGAIVVPVFFSSFHHFSLLSFGDSYFCH